MNADGSIDKNIISYNGPAWNSAEDVNHNDYGAVTATPDWQDTLKCSTSLAGFTLKAGRVNGGTEDCIDVNNLCSRLTLHADEWHSQGKYVATIKGGSGWVVLSGVIVNGGSEVDVDLGGHSDQSKQKTTGTVLSLTKADGSAVTVRVLNASKPLFWDGSGPYRYIFPHPDAFYHGFAVWFFERFRTIFWN